MSSSRYSWLRVTSEADLAFAREELEYEYSSFWGHVDSSTFGRWPSGVTWADVREVGCLAANSHRERCGQAPLLRVPFCAFHFDRAWERIEAFVVEERRERVRRNLEFDRGQVFADAGLEVAMVRQAQAVLARQPERVYFYAVDHAVKVGRSVNPDVRVKTLNGTKAPTGIDVRAGSLLGTIPGGSFVERELHLRFGAHRLAGEWFALEPIRGDIEHLLADTADWWYAGLALCNHVGTAVAVWNDRAGRTATEVIEALRACALVEAAREDAALLAEVGAP